MNKSYHYFVLIVVTGYVVNKKFKRRIQTGKIGYDISLGVNPEPCLCDSDNVYHKKWR